MYMYIYEYIFLFSILLSTLYITFSLYAIEKKMGKTLLSARFYNFFFEFSCQKIGFQFCLKKIFFFRKILKSNSRFLQKAFVQPS